MDRIIASRQVFPILGIATALLAHGLGAHATADPINVEGLVFINSAGGDFPDIPEPIDELVYFLAGPGLPAASGEVLETSSLHGTAGGLVVTRQPVPAPLAAGQLFDLTTHATFTIGQAIEEGWPESGMVYDIAGDFLFTAGTAVLVPAAFGGLTGTAPFEFSGVLNAFAKGSGTPVFSRQLRGRGQAVVNLFPPNPEFFDLRFAVEPIPEPATLLLIGGGLGVLRLTRRRRSPV